MEKLYQINLQNSKVNWTLNTNSLIINKNNKKEAL